MTKSFGTTEVLKGVDLEIADGEFVIFVGPSGCGNSTLLRTIAGLEEATGGDIAIGGRSVNDLSPSNRGIAMVFQSYALYPHMSVYENMAFGLKLAKADEAEIDRRVRGAVEMLNITDYLDRRRRAGDRAAARRCPPLDGRDAEPAGSGGSGPSVRRRRRGFRPSAGQDVLRRTTQRF